MMDLDYHFEELILTAMANQGSSIPILTVSVTTYHNHRKAKKGKKDL